MSPTGRKLNRIKLATTNNNHHMATISTTEQHSIAQAISTALLSSRTGLASRQRLVLLVSQTICSRSHSPVASSNSSRPTQFSTEEEASRLRSTGLEAKPIITRHLSSTTRRRAVICSHSSGQQHLLPRGSRRTALQVASSHRCLHSATNSNSRPRACSRHEGRNRHPSLVNRIS